MTVSVGQIPFRNNPAPVGGRDYPATWQEFVSWFSDEEACRRYLEKLRWGSGFECPSCRGEEGWRTSRGLWVCRRCRHQTSVTVGTVFEKTRIPLQTWFAGAWQVTSQKNGLSAQNLQRVLGLGSYQTAWTMLHRYRTAMVRPNRDPLRGDVEVDETYVGGIGVGDKRGRGAANKMIVAVAVEVKAPKGFGRVRLEYVPDVTGVTLERFVTGAVLPGSVILTDGWAGYNGLPAAGYVRKKFVLSSSGDPAHVSMPGVHRVAALLKRWLLGTHQGSVHDEHLQAYLEEFTFRFNRRNSRSRGLLFYRLLEHSVQTGPLRWGDVIGGTMSRPDIGDVP